MASSCSWRRELRNVRPDSRAPAAPAGFARSRASAPSATSAVRALDVGRQVAVVGIGGQRSRSSACAASSAAELRQRAQELDALRRGQQLDAEDVRGVVDHRLQPARGEGRHRHVVLLVGAGRQAVDAGRMRQRLVLARQRRRGHVGDHEAAVQARVGGEERRQARHAGVDQHRDAPLGDRADLGDRDRHRVGGQRHRLGVEVAARDDRASSPSARRRPAGCR